MIRPHRFLLLPGVRVVNLASHVLGLVRTAIGAAWAQTHGERPLLAYTYTAADWAGREFGRGSHPDGRVRRRIEAMGRQWESRPGASIAEIFPPPAA